MEPVRTSWTRDILALTLFMLILFGTFLGSRPLMAPDEGRYAEIPREMVASGDYLTPHLNGVKFFEKPPLFYWVESVPIRWFGTNEWSLRSANALLGILGCLIVYIAIRKLYDRRSGLLASTILATSALYATLAHIITPDLLLTILLTSTLLTFLLGTDQPRGRARRNYFWTMYALAALTTLAKGLIGIIFPGLIIFIWLCVTLQWRDIKTYCIPTGILIFALIAVPWHWLVQHQNPEFLNFYFLKQQFSRYLTSYAHRQAPFWFIPAATLGGFFPWVCFLLAIPLTAIFQRKKPAVLPALFQAPYKNKTYFILIWILVIFLFFSFSESKLLTYTLPIIPPLAIFTGCYLATYWRKTPPLSIRLGFILIAILEVGAAVVALLVARAHFPIYWYISIALLLISASMSMFFYVRKGFAAGFFALLFSFSLCLISFNLSYSALDNRSTKTIALALKPQLEADPSALIVNYRDYHQDLPVYLQRRIMVVSPQGELEFGAQHQDASDWIVDEENFWQRWNHGPKMFMLLTPKLYRGILYRQTLCPSYQTPPLFVLIEQPKLIVVTNKPQPPIQLP